MRLIRNVCKKCNNYNLLEREFNYEMGLCNKCLKKQIMPEIRYKGYFECGNFPSISGKILDITGDGTYLATPDGIYEVGNGFRNILKFSETFDKGKFSNNGLYFIASASGMLVLFSFENEKWCLKKEFSNYGFVGDIDIYYFNHKKNALIRFELMKYANRYCYRFNGLLKLNLENGSLEVALEEPVKKIVLFPNDNVLILYKDYRKNIELFDESLKRVINEIPVELIPEDIDIIYPIDNETIFIQGYHPYLLNVLKNQKRNLSEEKIDLFLPKKNLLIDIGDVFSNSGYNRLLYVYSLSERAYLTTLYFPESIQKMGTTYDNDILYVLTKNICCLISTVNWTTVAKFKHNNNVSYCRILNNKSVITSTEKDNIYLWQNVL